MTSRQPVGETSQCPDNQQCSGGLLIFGILWLGGVGSFVALVCGYVAKGRIAANPEKRSGHGIAVAGIVLGWIGAALALLLVVAFGVPLFAKARHDAGERTAQSSVRWAVVAAKTTYVDYGDFSSATPERLASVEPAVRFTAGDSDDPSVVSVRGSGEEFLAAARSRDGTCYFMKIGTVDTSYAAVTTTACSATAASYVITWSTSWD